MCTPRIEDTVLNAVATFEQMTTTRAQLRGEMKRWHTLEEPTQDQQETTWSVADTAKGRAISQAA